MCICVCVVEFLSPFLCFFFCIPFGFVSLLFFLMLLRYSKMQFYSCQGNLTPSAKMQALLAITSAPSPLHLSPCCSLYSCHVVPAPVVVVTAVFCLATLRYFLANDEVSRYILLLLPLFFSGSGKGRAHDTCIQGLMEGGKRFSVSSFLSFLCVLCIACKA